MPGKPRRHTRLLACVTSLLGKREPETRALQDRVRVPEPEQRLEAMPRFSAELSRVRGNHTEMVRMPSK